MFTMVTTIPEAVYNLQQAQNKAMASTDALISAQQEAIAATDATIVVASNFTKTLEETLAILRGE